MKKTEILTKSKLQAFSRETTTRIVMKMMILEKNVTLTQTALSKNKMKRKGLTETLVFTCMIGLCQLFK